MEQSWLNAVYGGILIGLSASFLLLTYGRVLGVSGIVGRIYEFKKSDTFWRGMFFLGTVFGGYVASRIFPDSFTSIVLDKNYGRMALAGVVVGFGTKMGNGCTSGHGVCGIGRLSPRGITATCIFIGTGVLTVFFMSHNIFGN